MTNKNIEVAVFGGGCFWCTEAIFNMLKGIKTVYPGYSGGTKDNPTYKDVSLGDTGHAECIKIEFDPSEISYKDLLTVFFASHDGSSLNKQGDDVGTQYRSVIFYTTDEQKMIAEDFINKLNNSTESGRPIVTEVVPLEKFYIAEDYHQDYYTKNTNAPYCELVINPKLEKVQMQFDELLRNHKK